MLAPMRYLFETEEHEAIRASARRFAQTHIAPRSAEWEEDEEFPLELYATAARAGVTGVGYPEALGGQGGDLSHVLVACDELIVAGRSVGTIVGLGSHGIALPPIVRFGTPAQQDRFVRPCLADGKVAALAVTEPGGGSDVASLATRAERDGDDYVVTGSKTFITSGSRADFVTAAVRTGGPGHGGVSLLVIERGTPGFSVGKKLKKTGWWASDTAELHFDGCTPDAGWSLSVTNSPRSCSHAIRPAGSGISFRSHVNPVHVSIGRALVVPSGTRFRCQSMSSTITSSGKSWLSYSPTICR